MLKPLIRTVVLGVSALSVMTANAKIPGVYVSGQLGYADTHMASKTDTSADFLAGSLLQFITLDSNINGGFSNNGLAGRLALGYQFNQNLAVEVGYFQLDNKKTDDIAYHFILVAETARVKLSQHAIDLAVKGLLPLACDLNVYGKLGIAYLTTTATVKSSVSGFNGFTAPPATLDFTNIAAHKWAPEAAVGVSYDITPDVSVDASWTHIQPLGDNRPGNIDFVAIGVGYSFG